MSEYITFEGRIEPLVWGRAFFGVLRLAEGAGAAPDGKQPFQVLIPQVPS